MTNDEMLDWAYRLPALQFPAEWNVVIVPPFGGALIRFHVLRSGNESISVYLDVEDNLGSVGEPYWELYPNDEGGCSRHLMDETDALLAEIASLL